jgi:hypothetical protein
MSWLDDVRTGFVAGWRESQRLRWVAPFGMILGGANTLFVPSRSAAG